MTHYETLGVSTTASPDDIKKAYRKLAMQYHPDKAQGDKRASNKFIVITTAYDCLINSEKRKNYDLQLHHEEELKTRSATDQKGSTVSTKQELKEFTVTVDAAFSFTGFYQEHEGVVMNFQPGFTQGDIFTVSSGHIRYRLEIVLKPIEGFTVDGRDLHTSLVLDKKLVSKGNTFNIPNHPNPLGQQVWFDKNIKSGDRICVVGRGLPNSDGPAGDLIVTVDFLPARKSVIEVIGKALGSFTGWVATVFLFLLLIQLFN